MPKLNSNRDHIIFCSMHTLLLLLIMMRYALQLDVPKIAFLIIIAVIAITGERDEIVSMCLCCIPLHECIDFFYSVVICMSGYILRCSKDIRINLSIILGVVMILWELIHCFGDRFSIRTFLTTIIPLFVLFIFMNADISKLDYVLIVRTFSLTTSVVCITLLGRVMYISNFNLMAVATNLRRLGMVGENVQNSNLMAGGQMNPNGLGIICVLATTGLMQLRNAGRGTKTDIALVCVLLIFGALTSSRTYLACLLLMIVLLFFSQKGRIGQKLRFLAIVAMILSFSLAVLNFLFPELLLYYFSRFQTSDLTTGRMDLMTVYNEFIVSQPKVLIFGIGLQDFAIKVVEQYKVAVNVPHNSIQELIIAWGLPGVILFAVLLCMMVWRSRQLCRRQGLINYILVIIILFKGLAGQMLNSSYTMLAFSYAYLSLCMDMQPAQQQSIFPRKSPLRIRSGRNINQLRRNTNK